MTRGLLAAVLLALCMIFSTLGAHAYPAADRSATAQLGDRTLEPHQIRLHPGRAEAVLLRRSTAGIVGVVHIYIGSGSTARAVAVGIYSDTGNRPGSLLSKGSASSLEVHAWSTIPMAPTQLASGASYWLAVLSEGGTLRYRNRRHGPCLSDLSVEAHLHELPQRWGTSRTRARTHCPILAYLAAAGLAPSLSPSASGLTAAPLQPFLPVVPTPSSPAPARSPEGPTTTTPPSEKSPPPPEEQQPPPPAAPTNMVLPVISGSDVEGETLRASRGTWMGSPTAYAYQWQDCDALGVGCLPVSGATKSSYELTASDVKSTVSVVVSASNAGGRGEAVSKPTKEVVAEPPPSPEEPSLTATHCWNEVETEGAARLEACGYPGPNNTGVEKGVTLTESSEDGGPCHVTLTGNDHYEDKRVKGPGCQIMVVAGSTGVVIKNDEVVDENECVTALCGNAEDIIFESSATPATNTLLSHDFVHGAEKGPAPRTTNNVVQTCIESGSSAAYVAEYVKTEHCSGFKLNSGGTLDNDYCPDNYLIAGEHEECVTDDSSTSNATEAKPLIVENSTIFQPPPSNSGECETENGEIKLKEESGCPGAGMTAAFFPQGEVAPIQEIRLIKDFFDGGAFTIYGGNEDDGITGPFIVRKDRFARCLAATCPKSLTEEAQGGGLQKLIGNTGDGYGYYAESGVYGAAYNLKKEVTTWSENFWDNNRETVAE